MEAILISSLEDCEAKICSRASNLKVLADCQLACPGRLSLLSPFGRDGRASASEGKGVGLGRGEGEG